MHCYSTSAARIQSSDSEPIRWALGLVTLLGAVGWSGCSSSGATQQPQATSAAECTSQSSASEEEPCRRREGMTAQRMKAEMQGVQHVEAQERRHEAFIDRNGGSAQP